MSAASIYRIDLRQLLILPYLILVAVGLLVPSDGGHGLFNIKSLAFIGAVFSLSVYCWIKRQLNWNEYKLTWFTILALSFILLWLGVSLVGMDTPWASSIDQFKLLLLTLAVVIMTLFVAWEKLLSYSAFLKTVVYANFAYSFIKVGVIALFLANVIDLEDLLAFTGIRYMSMSIYQGLDRLQTSVDIITPFLLYFVLVSHRLKVPFNQWFKVLYLTVSAASIFFSFSRFLIGVGALSFFFWWCTLRWQEAVKCLLVFLTLGLVTISLIGAETAYSIVERRFFSFFSAESDATRVKQIEAMQREFDAAPLLGKGIGGYAESVIRDPINYHSYEVQWMAFLMQFGLLGMLLLSIPLAWMAWQFLIPPLSRVRIGFCLLFFLWLASGLFNPFLISLTSGIVYSLFAWTGIITNQNQIKVIRV